MPTKTAVSTLSYIAAWNLPGCIPDSDVQTVCTTAQEGWAYILDTLDKIAEDMMWAPDREDDPDGPHSRTAFAIEIEERVEQGEPGFLVAPDGYVYWVETHDLSYNDKHTYEVGEIDNIPDVTTYCGDRKMSSTRGAWHICFRPSHHEANHASGDGSTILAVW